METLGVCELVEGLTLAWPRLWLDPDEVWVDPEEVWVDPAEVWLDPEEVWPAVELLAWLGVEDELADAFAVVAGWLARARPTVAPKASAEPSTSPRRASCALRRAIWIGVLGIDPYGTTEG